MWGDEVIVYACRELLNGSLAHGGLVQGPLCREGEKGPNHIGEKGLNYNSNNDSNNNIKNARKPHGNQ